jgi:GNAT superfamily N-acetyltransferase
MIIRAACAGDQPTLRRMVWDARLNPRDLNWRRFRVVVDERDERLLAIGQVREHRDGSRELASIVTTPDARGQGLATTLIRELLAGVPGPVYLTCRPELIGFYERLGFTTADTELPTYFRRIAWLNGIAKRVLGRPMVAILSLKASSTKAQ